MPNTPSTVRPELVEGLSLVCHPSSPSRSVAGVEISVDLSSDDRLWLRYFIDVPLDNLALPDPADPVRSDGLWQHTCCEIFLRHAGDDGYLELNFSPSSEWAAYGFPAYREGGNDVDLPAAPDIRLDASASGLAMEVEMELPPAWRGRSLVAALSAVIEEVDGTKSYWALRHPPGRPDFHHPDCFALTLGAREGA